MAKMLFASNSISHYPGSTVKNDAWAYDANRVPYALHAPSATVVAGPPIEPSTTQETWFHMRFGTTTYPNNVAERILEILTADAEQLFILTVTNTSASGYTATINTDTQTVTGKKFLPLATSQARTLDVQLIHTDLSIEMNVYINEILIINESLSQTSERKPVNFYIGGFVANGAGMWFSEVMISDADTRNGRLDLLRPVSGGVYGNFDGLISALSDDDPTTGMVTTLPAQKQSTILSPYGGADNISHIVQTTTTVRGINSPTQLKHFLRMSGVDYETAAFAVPFTKTFQVTDWQLNPATSSPWDSADLASMEFGFESVA